MKVAEKHRETIIEYISNPDNGIPDRGFIAVELCGYAHSSNLYKVFTPQELTEIEHEGLAERRKRYTPFLADIDLKMIEEAKQGNVAAAKLIYDRIEGAVVQSVNNKLSGDPDNPIKQDNKIEIVVVRPGEVKGDKPE